ncbi:hypothetical protein [Bradyrhizobium zhanjiangense]|uniref:hypothetical protein n=1 Tax=Bradyrhizobium zhanjiangense TaxID=1325107 RepID=UPI001008C461|nr:hypothetical protein [Bradyrhizobium zhanjiangense]
MLDYSKVGSSPRETVLGDLLGLAEKTRAESGLSIGFMVLWMSFNAWGSILTEGDKDIEMINRLAADQRIADTFRDRLASDADFSTTVQEFTNYWPIFCNSDIGLMGSWPNVQALYLAGRAATARELKKNENRSAIRKPDGSLRPGVRRRPRNDNFDAASPSWPDALEALYQVRNNLMHGTKGFDGDDHQIMEGAYNTLDKFVRGSGLYRWR